MKLSTILGGAALAAAAALSAAAPASAAANYSFLDGPDIFFIQEASPVTGTVMATPTVCTLAAYCSTVTLTATAMYDEVSTANGENFFFAPTAFDTTSASSSPLASPASFDKTAQFNALITSAAPEPSIWALMIAGMGMVGVALRRRATGSFSSVAA